MQVPLAAPGGLGTRWSQRGRWSVRPAAPRPAVLATSSLLGCWGDAALASSTARATARRRAAQAAPQASRRRIRCSSASSMVQDPADVIPDAFDSDDEDETGAWQPANVPVLVVGAGPVGLLAAMYLARRGYSVKIVDKQPDPYAAELLGGASEAGTVPDVPLVLSSRCLLAFEELGAKELLQGPLAQSLRGTWWVNGAPPGHHISTASSTAQQQQQQQQQRGRAVLDEYPGWSGKYTRRVLVRRSQLVRALLLEAERLYGDKIQLYWDSEFLSVDWDQRIALVAAKDSAGEEAEQAAVNGNGMAYAAAARTVDPLLPELATSAQDLRVPYGLLVGADGADSAVRAALDGKRPKMTDFSVQRPLRDTRSFKWFDSLPQAAGEEVVPGMASHKEREYEYRWQCPEGSAPSLRMWVPAQGLVCGTIESADDSWDAKQLEATLVRAYGSSLPQEWLQQIVNQTCGPDASPAYKHSSTVQCAQFHGPRTVLLGDAAHAMTSEYEQGVSCAVEGVRLLNIALKSAHNNLDKALSLYSEVRCEDVHSLQQLEFFQKMATTPVPPGHPGAHIKHADWVHSMAGALAMIVWQAAKVMMQLAAKYMPNRFPPSYVSDRMWDARRGYSDLLKVVLRFAAVPLLLAFAAGVMAARAALLAMGPYVPGLRWLT